MVLVEHELKNAYIGDYHDYLCFTANTANSTVQLTQNGNPTVVSLETSTDNVTWSSYTIGNTITLTNIGDKVYFRNTSTTTTGFTFDNNNSYTFVLTGSVACDGDVTYLINKDGTDTITSNYCFCRLFNGCTSLTTAPSLPATTLANQCYALMFNGCTSLTTAPKLPATTLTEYCYESMFRLCTSLTTAPSLPATTLDAYCYSQMFDGCSSLETLPKLYATTLNNACYFYMFNGCSKIKISSSQTGAYQTPYRIPTTGTGSAGTNSLSNMFRNTGGTFTGTPTINTTYYTSNTVV